MYIPESTIPCIGVTTWIYEPSVGFRADSYAIQWANENSNDFTERTVPDAKVEMSTRLNREYQVDFMDLTAVQHAIRAGGFLRIRDPILVVWQPDYSAN